MQIGIVGGTGPAGAALATRLADVGYEIILGSRSKYRSMEVVDKINAEYGQQPNQGQISGLGNDYLEENFPNLDFIMTATIVD